jgi:hypothetical protein
MNNLKKKKRRFVATTRKKEHELFSWVQSMELGDNSKSNTNIGPQGVEL